MSSIIDALKKSDDDRQGDGSSQLNQIKFGSEPPERSRRGFWLLVMFLLLVALGVYGWQQGWHHLLMDRFNTDDSGVVSTSQPAATEQSADQATQQSTAQNPSAVQTARPQTNKLTPPKPQDIKAQARTQAANDQTGARSRAATDLPPTVDHQARPTARPTVEATPTVSDQPTESLTVVKKPEPVKTPERKMLEPTMTQDHLLLHQVDFAIRKEIPPIKLTVHIYDPEPEKRMIMLNGNKYNVGDTIEEVITVEDITQEGVLLNFQGTRFLLPK